MDFGSYNVTYFMLKQLTQPMTISSKVHQSDISDLSEVGEIGRSKMERLNNSVTSLKMPFEEKLSLKDLMSRSSRAVSSPKTEGDSTLVHFPGPSSASWLQHPHVMRLNALFCFPCLHFLSINYSVKHQLSKKFTSLIYILYIQMLIYVL